MISSPVIIFFSAGRILRSSGRLSIPLTCCRPTSAFCLSQGFLADVSPIKRS